MDVIREQRRDPCELFCGAVSDGLDDLEARAMAALEIGLSTAML